MDTYWVKMYDKTGNLMKDESKFLSGFSLQNVKNGAKLSGADSLILQNKDTQVKKYYIAEYVDDKFLRWIEIIPQTVFDRIGGEV